MGLFRWLKGLVYIEIVSADIPGLLTLISAKNIQIDRIMPQDEITFRGIVTRTDYQRLYQLTKYRGDKLTAIEDRGAYRKAKAMVKRPVLLSGLIFLLLSAWILPGRILFVQVKGNCDIPNKQILEAAENCGISIFSSRRKIRSEKVKNALLEEIPQLQWVGVNTAGCVATINVREKSVSNQPEVFTGKISSIIATRDGIIKECTVHSGNTLCQVGQAVKAGQILVSGYIDCGIKIQGTRSDAEVYAQTLRDFQMISPVIYDKRVTTGKKNKKYSIIIGKKLIKLYNGSGISDASCVKIYDELKLTLPGGFQLPITLIQESIIEYDFYNSHIINECGWLEEAAVSYLQSDMIAGQIIDHQIRTQVQEDVYILSGQFSCLEMIGREKVEENLLR